MRHVLVTGAAGGLGSSLCDLLAASGDTVFAADLDEGEMVRSLEVNLLGAFRVVRAFFPLLAARRGRVVLVGTEMTSCPMPFTGPYTVSKCALQAFADALRRELVFLGMRVAVIRPGAIRTPLLSEARSRAEAGTAPTLFPAPMAVIRRMLAREWDHGMEPADVARVAVRALRARRPRSVYRVGNDPLRAMLAALPSPWIDALLRAFVRLQAPAPARRSASGAIRAPRSAARAKCASPRA